MIKAAALLLLLLHTDTAGAAKVKRVKAGKKYAAHDAVHLVVNKVGCVIKKD